MAAPTHLRFTSPLLRHAPVNALLGIHGSSKGGMWRVSTIPEVQHCETLQGSGRLGSALVKAKLNQTWNTHRPIRGGSRGQSKPECNEATDAQRHSWSGGVAIYTPGDFLEIWPVVHSSFQRVCVQQPVASSDESKHLQPGGPCARWALFSRLLPNMSRACIASVFSSKAVNGFIRGLSSTKTDSSNTNRQGFKRPSRLFFHNSWRGAAPPRSRMQIQCLKSAYNGSVRESERRHLLGMNALICGDAFNKSPRRKPSTFIHFMVGSNLFGFRKSDAPTVGCT